MLVHVLTFSNKLHIHAKQKSINYNKINPDYKKNIMQSHRVINSQTRAHSAPLPGKFMSRPDVSITLSLSLSLSLCLGVPSLHTASNRNTPVFRLRVHGSILSLIFGEIK